MYSAFIRIGALQAVGGLIFFLRAKAGALVLGTDGVGLVSVVEQFVQLMLQFSAFAIPFSAIKVLSEGHSESAETFRANYAGLLQLLMILGGVGAGLGIALICIRPMWVSPTLAAHVPLVVVGLLGLPPMILLAFFRNVPAAAGLPVTAAVWDIVAGAVMTGFMIAGMVLFREIGYFAGVLVGAVLVAACYHLYLANRLGLSIMASSPSNMHGVLRENPSFVELSLGKYVVALATPLALFIVRATVLENFGETSAGLLQAAIGISMAISLSLSPLNNLLLTPFVNRVLAAHNKYREAEEFQKKLLLAITVVVLPPILFPDLVVIALYSSQFIEAAHTLYWFVLGQAIMQIGGIYMALLIGLDRVKAYAFFMAAAMAVNVLLALLLVPRLGLAGAGIASFASAILLALATFGYLRVVSGYRTGHRLGIATLFLFSGLGLAGAFVGTRPSLELFNFLAKLLVCVVALGLMVPLSLDRSARRALLRPFGRR